jgi:GNAT superfamily N-acetyltransferase
MLLRQAHISEATAIWAILEHAIEQRRLDGSDQWQNGYPNLTIVESDIENGHGYVLEENGQIIAYAAIIFDTEPAYNTIEGAWLSSGPYVVIHRVATAKAVKGRGLATELFNLIEDLALSKNTYSIKVDTNFDNLPMLKTLAKLGYTYCGEIFFGGASRKAYEKLLKNE